MDDRQFFSIGQVQDQYLNPKTPKVDNKPLPTGESSFASVLNKIKDSADINSTSDTDVKFSKHAVNRLNDRNIELTSDQMLRLK
ncbi:MAG: flagellar protein, partial [Butyrivibrio sp.]|nr:flagellar protein [Butyrivibrio sp.]